MEEIKIKVQKNENIMKMHHLGGGDIQILE